MNLFYYYFFFLVGILIYYFIKTYCGCKVVEGQDNENDNKCSKCDESQCKIASCSCGSGTYIDTLGNSCIKKCLPGACDASSCTLKKINLKKISDKDNLLNNIINSYNNGSGILISISAAGQDNLILDGSGSILSASYSNRVYGYSILKSRESKWLLGFFWDPTDNYSVILGNNNTNYGCAYIGDASTQSRKSKGVPDRCGSPNIHDLKPITCDTNKQCIKNMLNNQKSASNACPDCPYNEIVYLKYYENFTPFPPSNEYTISELKKYNKALPSGLIIVYINDINIDNNILSQLNCFADNTPVLMIQYDENDTPNFKGIKTINQIKS